MPLVGRSLTRWLAHPRAGLIARLVVGGVWIYAGALKLPDPEASVTAVRGYQILPTGAADTVGHMLPILEVVLGLCLVTGLLTRVAGGLSALMQLAFVIGIASVWARGIEINCGCFGDGGPNPNASDAYPWEIARDLGLMALSVLLVVRPRTPFAVDTVLFPERSFPDPVHLEKQVEDVQGRP